METHQSITRKNHYVPEWYQKKFLSSKGSKLCYLNLFPDKKILPNGKEITLNNYHWWAPSQCFYEQDLYTTFFFGLINDEIEKYLFGGIDTFGFAAIRAFISGDFISMHKAFQHFFEYLDAQKIRTPKGLQWLQTKYPRITRIDLLHEMQQIRQMNCTMWVEAVREIVSAKDSEIKFIITDHPVTVYNALCPPHSTHCKYPDDPLISFKGSQTIFPLDLNHCLILTNLEYAKDPNSQDLLSNRTNARHFDSTISRVDSMIRSRKLKVDDVMRINLILKSRARRYIAATKKEWLFPEKQVKDSWADLGKPLLPPSNELYHFGGEIYIRYKDGNTHYQDAYGRTVKELSYLKKPKRKGKIGANDECICGSGKKYKKCCRDKKPDEMPITLEGCEVER